MSVSTEKNCSKYCNRADICCGLRCKIVTAKGKYVTIGKTIEKLTSLGKQKTEDTNYQRWFDHSFDHNCGQREWKSWTD